MDDFEKTWFKLVETLEGIGKDKAELLLDNLQAFYQANSARSSAAMVDQIRLGLRDWYEKPKQWRNDMKEKIK